MSKAWRMYRGIRTAQEKFESHCSFVVEVLFACWGPGSAVAAQHAASIARYPVPNKGRSVFRREPAMARTARKADFAVSQVRRYLEPGPIVLVSSKWRGKTNIMTMGWHMVMEFTPSLVACLISSGNHSHRMIRDSGECVLNLPTTKLTDHAIGIGNSSGSNIDKFAKFGLTA